MSMECVKYTCQIVSRIEVHTTNVHAILSLSLFTIHALPIHMSLTKEQHLQLMLEDVETHTPPYDAGDGSQTHLLIYSRRYSLETINWTSAISKFLISVLFNLNTVPPPPMIQPNFNVQSSSKNNDFATFYVPG